jgi:hypothetical protein
VPSIETLVDSATQGVASEIAALTASDGVLVRSGGSYSLSSNVLVDPSTPGVVAGLQQSYGSLFPTPATTNADDGKHLVLEWDEQQQVYNRRWSNAVMNLQSQLSALQLTMNSINAQLNPNTTNHVVVEVRGTDVLVDDVITAPMATPPMSFTVTINVSGGQASLTAPTMNGTARVQVYAEFPQIGWFIMSTGGDLSRTENMIAATTTFSFYTTAASITRRVVWE